MTYRQATVSIEASIALFDLDGTILDSIGHFWQVTAETFKRVGLEPPDRDLICASMRFVGGSPLEYLVPQDVPDRAALVIRCQAIAREVWAGMHPIYADLIPGADEAILQLTNRGVRVGIATASFGPWVEDLLKAHGIWERLDCLVLGHDVKERKPAPDLLIEAMRRLSAPPDCAVYIGDSPLDVRAAHAAGMASIGVLSGVSRHEDLVEAAPHAIVASITDVVGVIR